jgi:hypothetical protein
MYIQISILFQVSITSLRDILMYSLFYGNIVVFTIAYYTQSRSTTHCWIIVLFYDSHHSLSNL